MSGYRPETDTSPDIKSEELKQYKEMVRVIRWEFDLVRVYILLDTALMYTYLALPRRGHLEQIFRVFGYPKVNPKIKLCSDLQHPEINKCLFEVHDWYDFYRDSKEAIPADNPNTRGDVVSTHCFVDGDHAGIRATRRSQTGS